MVAFEDIYKRFEAIDSKDYGEVLAQKSVEVLPLLTDISGRETTGASLLAMFVLGAVLSDGELDSAEFEIIKPMFKRFFGEDISYSEIKALVKSIVARGNDLTETVDELIDLLGILSDEFKSELIMICLMICAIDGNVSDKERQWIKKLAD